MSVGLLLERFAAFGRKPAIVWRDAEYSYDWLLERIAGLAAELDRAGVRGRIVSLEQDYTPDAIAALFALLAGGNAVLPLDRQLVDGQLQQYLSIARATVRMRIEGGAASLEERLENEAAPSLLAELLREGAAGLVLFSSGSTGKSKAAVHRVDRLLGKFREPGRANRTLPFMMFDHIGGMNTLLQTLANGGCLCIAEERTPAEICRIIERHRVEAMPMSPTFMNLMLLSGAYRDYDLSCLRVVSYGSEVMPPHTLALWNAEFPA